MSDSALDLLRRVFGHPGFRGEQAQIVEHVASGGDALVQCVEILADGALPLDFVDRDAAVDRRAHDRVIVGDGVGHILTERIMDLGQPKGAAQPPFQAIDDDSDVEKVEVL